MRQTWKTIRIFISSTFRDMHAERDHLVRFVFPELKERCRKQRVHLIDVDLRWGVSEEDAQSGKALDICLDEIDSCRPYFLGLLGHRYGWTPPGEQYSITAQEITHGVLHNDLPQQVVDLRNIIEGKLEGKALTAEQVDTLVRCYRWDADRRKYLLREDATPEELDIIRAVFAQYSAYQRDRSFFFLRKESLSKKLAGKNTEDFFETDKTEEDKLNALKQDIKDSGLPYFEYDDLEVFGEKVKELLWQKIEAEIGQQAEEAEKDWLQEEAELHELFIADRTRRFVGRKEALQKMQQFCEQGGEPNVLMVTGEPGCGKSALLGRFTEEVQHRHPDWLILPHFIGASPNSTNLRQTLLRLCTHLSRAVDSTEETPQGIKELLKVFPELLEQAARQKRILIILDAVNQLEQTDTAHQMHWLPQTLPENVRVVLSTLPGEAHDALLARRTKPKVQQVSGLNETEIQALTKEYLREIRRDFPTKKDEQTFFQKVQSGHPLYILVALEELRVFGQFEQLSDRIKTLPDTVPDLFDQVLERVESDFHPALVRNCLVYIACGRHGMTAEELQTLLREHAPEEHATAKADRLPDMLWARLYRAFSAYLFERSGVIDFFHGQLKDAVGRRYLEKASDRRAAHKIIADYLETRWPEPYLRGLDELPYHLIQSEDWLSIDRIMTDIKFMTYKCKIELSFELIRDYDNILSLHESKTELVTFHKMELYRGIRSFLFDRIALIQTFAELISQEIVNYFDLFLNSKESKEFCKKAKEFCSNGIIIDRKTVKSMQPRHSSKIPPC